MILNILTKKSNFPEPLVLACNCLSDYLTDNDLANKHANKKVDEGLVDDLIKIQENYLDNPEVVEEVKNILSQLAMRKPELNGYIKDKSKLGDDVDKFKDATNLYDETHAKDAIKDFHDDVQKDFNDKKVKENMLNDEKVINCCANSSNPKSMEPLLTDQFINDLNKAIDSTTKDPEVSPVIEQLLVNEMDLAKKIKDNLPSKDDPKHDKLVDDAINILDKKSNFDQPLTLACKFLSDGVKDNDFYSKHLNKKLDDKFADRLCKIQHDHLNNPDVIRESNTLLDELSKKNPKVKQCVANNGGLANPIGEFEPNVNNVKCKNALDAFHNNLQKNFNDNKVKDDILKNEKDIDDSTTNIKEEIGRAHV